MSQEKIRTDAIKANITNTKERTFLVRPEPIKHKTSSDDDDAVITQVKITFKTENKEIEEAFKKDGMRVVLLYNNYPRNSDNDAVCVYVIHKTDSIGHFIMGANDKIEGSVKTKTRTYNDVYSESDIEDKTIGTLTIYADNEVTMERLIVRTEKHKATSPLTFVCDIPDSDIKESDVNKRNLQIIVSGLGGTQNLGEISPVFEFTQSK